MTTIQRIINEAQSLPVEERALIVDSLLRSLNPPDPSIDKEWIAVAKSRLGQLRSGREKPVPAVKLFKTIRETR